jgi:hypothetical protein
MFKNVFDKSLHTLYVLFHDTWVLLPQKVKELIRRIGYFQRLSLWIIRRQNNAILKDVSHSKEKSFIASIDVVITSHKQAMYLEEAIKSVLIQTFQPQTIIVVIHDEDAQEKLYAEEIIVNYEKLIDIKMLVINECWPGEARNAGSRLSNADAIVFLDVDDVFELNYFFNCINYYNYFHIFKYSETTNIKS